MHSSPPLESRKFPARIADLGFSVQLPSGWIAHELPEENPDFATPTFFVPLAVVTAPHAAIVYAFAARPAHEDGTLHDWAWYHLKHNQLQPRAIGQATLGDLPAVVGEAMQESEMGPMRVRFAFAEDGKRLLNISLMAPEMLADTVQEAWMALLRTFALETPLGPSVPATPEALAATRPAVDAVPPLPAAVLKALGESPTPTKPKKKESNTFARHALAEDTKSLDPETSINANIRDRGAGLVPVVTATDDGAQRAYLAAGAILAEFSVPYGWHVVDDGRRVLVFEPSGAVQIHLHLLPREGRSDTEVVDALEAQTRSDYPNPEFVRQQDGRIQVLGVRNIQDGAQALEQYHMLTPGRNDRELLRARVTATPERAGAARNLARLILESTSFDCQLAREAEAAEASVAATAKSKAENGQPAWWHQAVTLEIQGDLEGAEKTIRSALDHIGFAASTAEMYRLRMHRLADSGDADGARAAFKKAHEWIGNYAGMATSGGEGAALSYERDQFRAKLVQEFGSDPSGDGQ